MKIGRILLPGVTEPGVGAIIATRSLRGLADGFVSVVLVAYVDDLGFSAFEIGTIVTATLLGSAALTLGVGLRAHRLNPRTLLLAASVLMLGTGAGFATVTDFWPLLVVAFAGTLNPAAGDVSVFLPVEQSLLASRVAARQRTALFARYNLAGAFAGALGALASGLPSGIADAAGWAISDVYRGAFLAYGLVALLIGAIYLTWLPPPPKRGDAPATALGASRPIVLRLAALFSLDSFGGGFVVQSLLALWLFNRFDLAISTAGAVFFAAGLLTALSQLASSWLAGRIGLVNTMVFTHLPANVFLVIAAFMPTAELAIGFLLARMALSQMDVPARQSFVMQVVSAAERAAAASITNVPRSLASALSPALAGLMLSVSSFGWPLVAGGVLKVVYDLLLLGQFASRQHDESPGSGASRESSD